MLRPLKDRQVDKMAAAGEQATARHAGGTRLTVEKGLVQEASLLTGIESEREVVEEALRLLVRMRRQEAVRALRGKVTWEGDLNAMRRGRFSDEGAR